MKHGTKKERKTALKIFNNGCDHKCKSCFLLEWCDHGRFTPKEAAERFVGGMAYIK